MYNKSIILFFTLLLSCFQVSAQITENVGSHYLETFQGKSKELEKSQVWSIVPGNGNYMFFASNDGLGVYDGVRWEIYNTNEGRIFRSLFFESKSNVLYCGSVNEFGKWIQKSDGRFEYTPIWVNEDKNMYVEFWRVNAPMNSDFVYFQSHQLIVKYNIRTGEIIELGRSTSFRYLHVADGDVWVQDGNTLYRMDINDNLNEVIQVDDRIIQIVVQGADKKLLLVLEHKGIFVLTPNYKNLIPLNEETNQVLSNAKIFAAHSNEMDELFLGTTREGLFILSGNGSITRHIGEKEGLPIATVLSVNNDYRGNIWMGLDAGVCMFEKGINELFYIPTPSIGNVRSIVPVHENVYIGTNQGLFKLSDAGKLSPIRKTSGSIWSLYNIEGKLFFNHDQGLFQLVNDEPVLVKSGGAISLVRSLTNPEYFIGGNYYGLSLYKVSGGELRFIGNVENYAGTARFIQFDRNGFLWVMLPREGFLRIKLSDDMLSVEEIKRYDMPQTNGKNHLMMVMIDNRIVFSDGTYSYVYDVNSLQFKQDEEVNKLFRACGENVIALSQFNNIFWYQTSQDIGYVIRNNNGGPRKYEKYGGIFSRIYNRRISSQVSSLDAANYVLGFQNGIALTQIGRPENNVLKIRMTEGYGSGESVFYDFTEKSFRLPNKKRLLNIYPVNLNPNNMVEYRIVELNEDWQKAKVDDFLTITYLESGNYTIQIRNADDNVSVPAEVHVSVARPWYAGNLMIMVYVIILICILLLLSFYYQRKMEKNRRSIERKKQAEVEKLEKENLLQSQQILQLEKDKLEIALNEKDKRLAYITMNAVNRSNLMNELKEEISKTNQQELNKEAKQTIKNVIKKIDEELKDSNDWEAFEKYFNVVFSGLLEKLAIKYPQLTQGDLKLLAYIKLNLTNKEIANLLNISFRSVEVTKYRLRKKLNLDANDNFTRLLNSVENSENK